MRGAAFKSALAFLIKVRICLFTISAPTLMLPTCAWEIVCNFNPAAAKNVNKEWPLSRLLSTATSVQPLPIQSSPQNARLSP